jgi:hypothetical protein
MSVRVREPDGTWDPTEPASTTLGEDSETADAPRLAFDAAGNLYAAWHHYDEYDLGGMLSDAVAAVRPAHGTFTGASTMLSTPGEEVWPVAIAAGPPGEAFAAYPRGYVTPGSIFPAAFQLEIASFTPGDAPADAPGQSTPSPPLVSHLPATATPGGSTAASTPASSRTATSRRVAAILIARIRHADAVHSRRAPRARLRLSSHARIRATLLHRDQRLGTATTTAGRHGVTDVQLRLTAAGRRRLASPHAARLTLVVHVDGAPTVRRDFDA